MTTIEGDLVVYAHGKPDKTTVKADHISAIDGGLTIQVPDSLNAVDVIEISFPKLKTVGTNYVITGAFKELAIKHDVALTVDGMMRVNGIVAKELDFPGAETVKKDLSIDGNDKLERLGLDALTTVEGSFLITDHSKLVDVSFPSLKTVKRDVTIKSNAAIKMFELSALESAGTISFTSNADDASVSFPHLSTLGGSNGTSTSTFSSIKEIHLPSLSKVNGALTFQSTSMDDLTIPLLKMLNGSITVGDNPSLTTLALPRASFVGDIFIEDNDKLSNLTANGLRTVGTVSIIGSALDNVEFFGLEEVKGDFKVKGAEGMDCSWFDQHIKSITNGKYFCKGDHNEKERKPSTGGIEDTEGNPDDYIVTLTSNDGGEQTENPDEEAGPSDPSSGGNSQGNGNGDGGGDSGGLSTGAIAGMGVGVAIAVLLILGVILWFHRRRRRQALPLPMQRESKIITVSEQSSVTHSSSSLNNPTESGRHTNRNIFDEGQKEGVQTKIEANIHISALSMHRGGEINDGFGSSVFRSASETAYEVGFKVLNAIQSVKDRRKRISD